MKWVNASEYGGNLGEYCLIKDEGCLVHIGYTEGEYWMMIDSYIQDPVDEAKFNYMLTHPEETYMEIFL